MKKGILVGFGSLFVIALLISGCSKPEEKKAEAPVAEQQMEQEQAPAANQEMGEQAAPSEEAAPAEEMAPGETQGQTEQAAPEENMPAEQGTEESTK